MLGFRSGGAFSSPPLLLTMPIGYDILEEGFDCEIEVFARTLSVARTGQTFMGIIDANPAFVPDSMLGQDPREVGALEIRQGDSVDIVQSDTIMQDGVETWTVSKRDNYPSDFKVKYWLVKIA